MIKTSEAVTLTAIFTALLGLMTGIILWRIKKSDEKAEKRAATRIKADQLMQEGISCIGGLTYANSIAIRDHKCNGEMSAAMECYQNYRHKRAEFTQQLQAEFVQGR